MTSEEVSKLPEKVREYIHDLETLCDPAGLVRENALLKNENEMLRAKLREVVRPSWKGVY